MLPVLEECASSSITYSECPKADWIPVLGFSSHELDNRK